MGDTWIIDMTHFQSTAGEVVGGAPGKLAAYFGSIAAAASQCPVDRWSDTDIRCRRRPGRRPCAGHIRLFRESDGDAIEWYCVFCDDQGVIRNWRGTCWDARRTAGSAIAGDEGGVLPPSSQSEAGRQYTEAGFLTDAALAEVCMTRLGLGSAEAAENKLRGALELERGYTEALNLLAQICAQTGRPEEGVALFRRALKTAPGVGVELTVNMASVFEGTGEWEGAIEVYRLGLALHEAAPLHNGLGYCYGKLGRRQEEKEHARRAVALEPGVATYHNDLGWTLLCDGELADARSSFERAVELDPSDELARNNLSECLRRAANPSKLARARRRK